jgi:chromosome segregation ATPase
MMNNFLNKNSLIGALIILLLLTSWWGQSKTGANKQLTRDKEAVEVQLVDAKTKSADIRQALQEKTAALTDAEEKLGKAETRIQSLAKEFSEKKSALTALNKDVKVLLKKINELELALKNAKDKQVQTGSEHQKNVQETNAAHNEALAKLKKAEARIAQLEKELTELKAQAEARMAELKAQTEARTAKMKAQTEAQIAQLRKKQNEAATENESLRAQVIGFEKVVEERNAALAEVDSDLQSCKVNTKVLLSKITEQENAQQGMAEKMHLMVQDLSEEAAAHKNTTPVQEKQPAHAE